ncbi:DNA CROSS-LINK REPAIR PROTEIN PSO2/SNM1-RELATED [Salix viminalis]|uniref:DNA CROSS-LINK REPAIR PROTEIN PSO2/SNM1-RELATED n=1 Tax=Salix viminalis TaxID=40686 RepID=A0A9Q0NRY1_SALVM|nr:DNA CROSS-LINK REPAIR PROTEIN PSO2/SNM1-RELATED [Salix viminalis]KAJ6674830.1 DNA CROSS-LINK REPAIR PROTEIN PSO2/SNM1-RELATED [Salix viminalis]
MCASEAKPGSSCFFFFQKGFAAASFHSKMSTTGGAGGENDSKEEWNEFEWSEDALSIIENIEEQSYQMHPSIKQEEGDGGEGSFAAEFYRCGTEWSCLSPATEVVEPSHSRNLKQANLWQMWGQNKPSSLSSPPPQKKLKLSPFCSQAASSSPKHNRPRACPFYKRIPDTGFSVDAFRYGPIPGCSAYFLTHFHYDHYGGLTKGWSHGPVYCTPLTARLLTICLSLDSLYIHPLELDKEYVIQGVKVTLLEANHCPGAALLHFRLTTGICYLHTGDFRASKLMQAYPLLANNRVNVLYLDTTYCNPKYKFPSKEDVLSYVVRVTKSSLKKQPKTLVVVGAYSIGKESVYLAISKALGVKIYANNSRRRTLKSFGWPDLSTNLCTQATDTCLHVLTAAHIFPAIRDLEGLLEEPCKSVCSSFGIPANRLDLLRRFRQRT